jgi:hypothetical protein
MNAIAAFWFAYIVTRPLGASFADWLAWPPSIGGLGFGHGAVSAYSTVLIVGMVVFMAVTGRDVRVRRTGSDQLADVAAGGGRAIDGQPSHGGRHRRYFPVRPAR